MASDLKRKLARLPAPHAAEPDAALTPRSAPPPPAASGSSDAATTIEDERRARIATLRALVRASEGEHAARRPSPRGAGAPRLPGAIVATASGPLHRVERSFGPDHRHGRVSVVEAASVSAASLAALALDATLQSVDPRRVLFLDTETTGLSGGTGTLPFLVGMGWFEGERLVLEQLLLRKPGEERPLLERLGERLGSASAIVTYNGKSFDWPLLRTRAVMNRVAVPPPRAHLDLLHCARRVFGPRLGQVRLVQMEEEVLGFVRHGDVDGAQIPALFWDFVRSEDESLLAPVLEHNVHDVVALAALVTALAERWEGTRPDHTPEDRLSVARIAYRYGDHPRALARARDAADAGGSEELTTRALVLGAKAAQKTEARSAEEAFLLEALAHAEGDATAAIRLSLAKLYEHRLRDLDRALEEVQLLEAIVGEEAMATRRARLERKRAARAAQRKSERS